jgi:hypothetical protein
LISGGCVGAGADADAADVVFDDDALDDGLDDLALIGVEARNGLEFEAEVVVGASFALIE